MLRVWGVGVLSAVQHACLLVEQRISDLERTVRRLTSVIADSSNYSQSQSLVDIDAPSNGEFPNENAGHRPAPLVVIQDAVSETAPPSQTAPRVQDIVAKGLLSSAEAENLLSIFQTHYGRWIGLDEVGYTQFRADSIKSPLLLCANHLFLDAQSLVRETILHTQHSIEFFQAILLLSLWPTTLGQRLMSIDSWLISGYALQNGLISNSFKSKLASDAGVEQETSSLRSVLVRNHLCLAHLHASVSMRRQSMVTKSDVEASRKILQSDIVTNFETRMVAELHLYWTIYEQCVAVDVHLPRAKAALQSWKEEWAFLFNQPRRQFLEISFFFAGLLMYEQSLSSKSAAVRESLVSEMIRLSSNILTLSMEKADERTKHLTDHVYHVITFAAVTLCRLIWRYKSQLEHKINLTEKDGLVTKTIDWLCAIDEAPHVGKVMATLIGNVQRKLQPNHQEATQSLLEIQRTDADSNAIPDFLAMEDYFDFDWDGMAPDWQSLASDDFFIDPGSV
ncbi:hypothetical protein BDY17DRAFT_322462 [Neohortaea acidophila]|uniref:Transcription factor domain-containing protein n=1 Tax=Neohortaea acidophila TaxID=245834 RepID=A0A6A6Q1T3_9PEZI|nr:uncharacterized protein BDY17DRAFT_322462 [Neohortaea acidophila]KAF2485633.1 hypothetical protein BDY17DRAFT_322462 [Neohortaea acidophila]